jgi:uncharacterized protein YqfA (UPF0365 family)
LTKIRERGENTNEVTNMMLQTVSAAKLAKTVLLVIIVLVALVWLVLFLKFHRLWLQAKLSCAEVRYAELIGMYLRHSDYRTIVLCRIMAVQGGLTLSARDLESHYLAGGRIADVVRALILAKKKKIDLSWEDATAMDIEGRDLLAEVERWASDEPEPAVEKPELHFGHVGRVVSTLELAGRARFGDATVDVVAHGPVIEEGTKVVVAEIRGDRIVVRAAED